MHPVSDSLAQNAAAALSVEEERRDSRCWRAFFLSSVLTVGFVVYMVIEHWEAGSIAATDPLTGAMVPYSFHYLIFCFLGGVIAGLAHVVVTPIDLVKCRMQVGECQSFGEGFHRIYHVEAKGSCLRAVPLFFRGWAPTLVGYCIQGGLKFSLYEAFKYLFLFRSQDNLQDGDAGVPLGDATGPALSSGVAAGGQWYAIVVFLFASFLAELIADVGLSPWEAVKVKMQTTYQYPPYLRVVVPRMWALEGCAAFYKGLVPLWCRQVPYTMMKFASFEKFVQLLQASYDAVAGSPDAVPGKTVQLCVTLLAGLLAGVLCCVVSHPADTIVSKLNQRGRPAHNDVEAEGFSGAEECHVATADTYVLVDGPNSDDVALPVKRIGAFPRKALSTSAPAAVLPSSPLPESVEVMVPAAVNTSLLVLVKEIGWRGLWKGLLPRLSMVSVMTAMQWFLYDTFKVLVGLPTTGRA